MDEDISRLLKSLPSWSLINQAATTPTPGNEFTPTGRVGIDLKESEQEIRQRTQREAEILIGNLGTQKQIKKTELITDMDHVRALACMHESLQWFATSMRNLLANLSKQAQEIIKCRIQMSTINGQVVEEVIYQLYKISNQLLIHVSSFGIFVSKTNKIQIFEKKSI